MTTKAKGAKPAPKKPTKKPVASKAAGSTVRARKAPKGRPTLFSERIASRICAELADGMSLRQICMASDMPDRGTVIRWLADDERADFCNQYARAREAQADFLAEEILAIADDGRNDTQVDEDGNVFINHDVISRSKLRVDARKWLASKMAPKKYGDKIQAEHTGANGGAIQVASTVTFVRPPERGDDE